jgi:5-hydroxyisourate hydrolase
MSNITTHVLDTSRGRPAAGVAVMLDVEESDGWATLGFGRTDADGRLRELLPTGRRLSAGTYRLTFGTGEYFAAAGTPSFYPSVSVTFVVRDAAEHYHVPLLVSPYGYSTYRGS